MARIDETNSDKRLKYHAPSQRSVKLGRVGDEPWWLRTLLVMSGMSPLFVLWGIRGTSLIPDWYFVTGCVIAFFVSNIGVGVLVAATKIGKISRTIRVAKADDKRSDVIAYLFAMMLPFYTVSLDSWRDMAASGTAFLMVLCLFVGLRLHYLNFWFTLFRYHCYKIETPSSEYSDNQGGSFFVLTRNDSLSPGDEVSGLSVTPSFILET